MPPLLKRLCLITKDMIEVRLGRDLPAKRANVRSWKKRTQRRHRILGRSWHGVDVRRWVTVADTEPFKNDHI